MKRNILISIIIIVCGLYYWFNGLPFLNVWLFGNITGEIAVKINDDYLEPSRIKFEAKEEEKYYRVRSKEEKNHLRYTVHIDDNACYRLVFTIPGECVTQQMDGENIQYILYVPAELFAKNTSDIIIEIKEVDGIYKSNYKVVYTYHNGNKQELVKETVLNKQKKVELSFNF